MTCRRMVEVFDIVKEYYFQTHKDENRYMCVAARDAFWGGQITSKEMNSLTSIIKDEMQAYADFYIPKGNNFRVDKNTTLIRVIVEALKCRHHYDNTLEGVHDLYEMAQGIIPSWWDTFYGKLKMLEE